MKLPIIASLLVAFTLLQSPIVSAQIRGENPNHSSGDRRHNNGERPGRYEGDRNGGYRDDGRHDGRNDGIRPTPRPAPYPEHGPRPHPGPHPHPGPQPHPHPHPGPNPYPHPRPRPEPYPYPDYPRDDYKESSVQFYGVTRSIGGEWLRIGFRYPAYVDFVSVYLYSAALRVHDAYAVTESGRRISLTNLIYAGVIYAGQRVRSEYISAGERIVAIDIRAESMGNFADVSISVVSRYEYPSIYPIRY